MLKLYTYWRSTAAYRVRIALNLKGIDYQSMPVHLVKDGGEQHKAEYKALNPQGLVPALVTEGGEVINQSMAIMEYLETTYPDISILPIDAIGQAKTRAMAQMIVSDIHPLNNLRVLKMLKNSWNQTQVDLWYAHWIHEGFTALEQMLQGSNTSFMNEMFPCISDICLVAQVYNAERFNVPLNDYPRLMEINQRCMELPAFKEAAPEAQLGEVK
ncbi:maleylacetoacetate isomerase [Marinicella litoralis]|uniref:Maleylacetoacetate isomerase n=1 Tax=Marinicella litoralis TaxID=644220 RepID=A0A4R6XW03_9GAMM|nr:maleylacetoacetate isomerase [Marinicella litoralis]TDR22610.1 maleylacetoacetate isomerase [Marinicella litoralis]